MKLRWDIDKDAYIELEIHDRTFSNTRDWTLWVRNEHSMFMNRELPQALAQWLIEHKPTEVKT